MNLLDRLTLHAAEQPTQPALAWPGGEMSYASLVHQIEGAMRLLQDLDAKVVAVDLGNGPAWVVLDIAAMQLGICLVPLPSFFSPGQLRHVVDQSAAHAVVSDDVQRLRERLGELLHDRATDVEIALQTLSWIETRRALHRQPHPLPHGVHKITFTSGTTGEPKGVMLSWPQIRPVVSSLVSAVGMGRTDRHLALMPLAVLLENIGGIYAPLWAGAAVSLLPMAQLGMSGSSALDGSVMARALSDSKATTAIFTPQLLQGLVEAMEGDKTLRPALRFVAVGGAPLSPRLLQRATALGLPVFEGYGLSECGSVVCLSTAAANRPGSVGRPLPHVRLRIADDGEVIVRGQPFIGYLGDAPGSQAEWHTGDLGELDAHGYLYLRGRRRNVFITAFGRNVAPEWVERELTLEPAIVQAAVFGEAQPYNVAVVVPRRGAGGAEIDAALLSANRMLPDYARVARWVAADSGFSSANGLLTGTGRIRRDAVLERYRVEIESLYYEANPS